MTKFAGFGRSRAIRAGASWRAWRLLLLWGGPAIGAEPLSLDQCIDLALKNNPVLAQSQWQLEGARATHMAGSSAFLPSLHYSLTGGRSRSWVTQNLLPYIDEHTGEVVYNGTRGFGAYSTSYSHRLSLSQNIVNLPDWYRYSASGADLASSREVYRGSRADLVYQVRQEYFSLLGAILLQQNAREALTVSEDQLKRSQALFDVGSVARSDVLQARVTRANAVRDEISARNSVEQSRAQLAVILGKSVQDSVEIRQDVTPSWRGKRSGRRPYPRGAPGKAGGPAGHRAAASRPPPLPLRVVGALPDAGSRRRLLEGRSPSQECARSRISPRRTRAGGTR